MSKKISIIPPNRANIKITGPIMSLEEVHKGFLQAGSTASELKPIDWRVQAGCLSEVKDQEQCGDCWAMSSTSALTDRFIIQKGEKGLNLEPAITAQCVPEVLNQGCGGGSPYYAGKYFEANGTRKIEKSCPHWKDICMGDECKNIPTCQSILSECAGATLYKAKQGSTQSLTAGNGNVPDINTTINNIKRELLNGPVVASFFVPEDFMIYDHYPWKSTNGIYINGAYNDDLEKLRQTDANFQKFLNYNNIVIKSPTDWSNVRPEGHAVSIVGWNYGNAGKAGKVQYWIVRNSWGDGWGEGGFFRIAMNDGSGNNTGLGFDVPIMYQGQLFGGCVKCDPDLSTGSKIVCEKGKARDVSDGSTSGSHMKTWKIISIILGSLLAVVFIYYIISKYKNRYDVQMISSAEPSF